MASATLIGMGITLVTKVNFERPPDAPCLGVHLRSCVERGLPFVERDAHTNENVIICSTGSSIKDRKVLSTIKKRVSKGWKVFGLKETIPFLREHNIPVHFSCSMDPGGDRQIARTPVDTDVTYCVASSCHPSLFDHLLGNGCKVEVFHSACGHQEAKYERGILLSLNQEEISVIDGEFELKTTTGNEFCPVVPILSSEVDVYMELFGHADVMQGGFTVTNRTLALAKYMGFKKVLMAGTDFGWRDPDGSHYSDLVMVPAYDDNVMNDGGEVDGKMWYTKPDQLASAVDIAKKIKAGEVKVLGDSLAAALAKCGDAFLEKVVRVE